jgi:hypothetical protein
LRPASRKPSLFPSGPDGRLVQVFEHPCTFTQRERTRFTPPGVSVSRHRSVVSGEFSKKADHGKWFGAKAKNHQQKEYHDPPEAER